MSTCQLARAKLAQYVAGVGAQWGEKFVGLSKAGKLANPVTPVKNTLGNAGSVGVWSLATQPLEVAMDYFVALGQAAKQSVTEKAPMTAQSIGKHRTKALAVDARGLKEARRGWEKGVAEFKRIMKTGVDPDVMEGKLDAHRVTYETPMLQTFHDKVFGLIGGSDKPFFEMSFRMSLYSRAKVLAMREGLSGDAASQRIGELLRRPTEAMSAGAVEDATKLTFRTQGPVGFGIGRMKGAMRDFGKSDKNAAKQAAGQAALAVTESVVPFVSTPLAVASTMVDYSPLGLLKTAAQQIPKATRGRSSLIEGLSRATVGTTAGIGIGWALAEQGILTGAAPTSSTEREQWSLEGKMENAVRIGDRWYSLGVAAPALLMPLWGANLYDQAQRQQKGGLLDAATDGGVIASTIAAQSKSLTEQTFLSGLKDMIDAATQPDRKGSRFMASMVNQLNPLASMTGRVARATDPYVREQDSFVKDIAADIPGLSHLVPKKLDTFGQPIKKEANMASNAAHALFDPASSRRAKDDALLAEMRRLKIEVGRPGRSVKVMGSPTKRTDAEYRQLMQSIGPETRAQLEALVQLPEYSAASDEERAKAMEDVIRDLRKDANKQFKNEKVEAVRRKVGRPK